MSNQRYAFEGWVLDCRRGSLSGAGGKVALRPKSFELLRHLVENAGRLQTRDNLLDVVWSGVTVTEDSLTHCVSEIRQALHDTEQRLIKTVPKRGYVLETTVISELDEHHSVLAPADPILNQIAPTGPSIDPRLLERPTIVVLPFANVSGDVSQEYLSDGITDDIINGLSQFSELSVIARHTSFSYKGRPADIRDVSRQLNARYIVDGSVRRLGDRLRITAQLVDGQSGVQRWAGRFDHTLEDSLAVLDESTQSIVRVVAAHLGKAEEERASRKQSSSWTAYDLTLQGDYAMRAYLRSWTVEHLYRARRLFQEVFKIEPGNAKVCAELAHTFLRSYHEPLDQDYTDPRILKRGFELACEAVALDPHLPIARAHLGWALLWMRQLDAAVSEFEAAIALNPNFSDFRFAAVLVYAGASSRALDLVRSNLRYGPLISPHMHAIHGHALHMLHRYSEAVAPLAESIRRTPRVLLGHLWLAATLVRLGERAEARSVAAKVVRLSPRFSLTRWPAFQLYRDPKETERMISALRDAGLN